MPAKRDYRRTFQYVQLRRQNTQDWEKKWTSTDSLTGKNKQTPKLWELGFKNPQK